MSPEAESLARLLAPPVKGDPGELSVIAYSVHHPEVTAVLHDRAAVFRGVEELRGRVISIHGLLGRLRSDHGLFTRGRATNLRLLLQAPHADALAALVVICPGTVRCFGYGFTDSRALLGASGRGHGIRSTELTAPADPRGRAQLVRDQE